MGRNLFFFLCLSISSWLSASTYDIIVYGGTSGGVIAAVQAARTGKSVLLISPSKHLGGMTSSGLGWVDAGNPASVGGLAHEFFHRIWLHYQKNESWIWEEMTILADQHGPVPPKNETMWVLEPHVAEKIFDEMITESKVNVVRNERLDRSNGVQLIDQNITQIKMESGNIYAAKMFIDASYEGDLMAAAGVSYFVGRESNALYQESSNGIRANIRRGDIPTKLDPYIIPGEPSSGLLPRIFKDLGGVNGEGDRGIQAYNYRMCLTSIPENRVPIEKPENYDELDYEIIFRTIGRNVSRDKFMKFDRIPNRKTDSNNRGAISTDYIGMSWNYPEADYNTREQIALSNENWQRGLLWTLQYHPRVPEKIRNFYLPWGLPKDEFVDNNHWPYQLYVREGRRMIGSVVVTEQMAMGSVAVEDSIGLGSYSMDSHAIKYFVADDGYMMTDGCLFIKLPGSFPISYRALVPKKEECTNLLVTFCLSSTHVAYGALRLEPIFMVLGQSAATAACIAIDENLAIQDVPYVKLRELLLNDLQKL